MQEHGILDNGETETCAAHVAASTFVYTVESLKDAGKVFGRYAVAIVFKGELPAVVQLDSRNLNGGPLSGIVDGIVHQIAEYAV